MRLIALMLLVPTLAAAQGSAQLAPVTIDVKDTYEGELAVRVSVPELKLEGLAGQAFYFGACFRSLQGGWSEWVTTSQWSVPNARFKWASPFSHFFRASRLAEEDFANGAFIARVAVFDGRGRELAFREVPFQVSWPRVDLRDCGTGQDLGCSQALGGVLPLERAAWLELVKALRAEKKEGKRLKRLAKEVSQVTLTAAQFTALLDLFPGEGPRFDAANVAASRVVNLADARSYGSRFKAPDLRARYGSLLRSIIDPDAQPRAWRAEGDMDHVGFTFEAPTREELFAKCVTWKDGNIRIAGFVMRVALKGGPTRTDMLRTDAACSVVRDGSIAVY